MWRATSQAGVVGFDFDVEGYVEEINFTPYGGLVSLEGVIGSHSAGDTFERQEGGNAMFPHTAQLRSLSMTPAGDEALQEWAVGDGFLLVQTNNDEFLILGAHNGMQQIASPGKNSGEAKNSPTTRAAVFEGAERTLPLRFKAGTVAATLTKIQSYEVA